MARWAYRVWAFFVSSTRLWELLARTGIVVFVGPNGSGKSLVMVQAEMPVLAGMAWLCWDAEHRHHRPFNDHARACEVCDLAAYLPYAVGSSEDLAGLVHRGVICDVGRDVILGNSSGTRLVYSTVPLTLSKGVPHPLYVPLSDYRQLLTIEHADVLFDEVAGIADASASASMPVQVVNWQHKLRKADIRQRVTTPAYARCALPIRQVAQVVVEMRSFFPTRQTGLLWRPRRLVLATAYDANSFDDFMASDGQRDRLKPMARGLLWVPTCAAVGAYNTLGQVLSLGHVTEGGMCIACGGSRQRPKCVCDDDHEGTDLHELEVVTQIGASGARTRKAVKVAG
jgi:ligand-binding SRPBCC domain-containing protein